MATADELLGMIATEAAEKCYVELKKDRATVTHLIDCVRVPISGGILTIAIPQIVGLRAYAHCAGIAPHEWYLIACHGLEYSIEKHVYEALERFLDGQPFKIIPPNVG